MRLKMQGTTMRAVAGKAAGGPAPMTTMIMFECKPSLLAALPLDSGGSIRSCDSTARNQRSVLSSSLAVRSFHGSPGVLGVLQTISLECPLCMGFPLSTSLLLLGAPLAPDPPGPHSVHGVDHLQACP